MTTTQARLGKTTTQDTGLQSLADRKRLRAVLRPFRTPVRGHAFAAPPSGAATPRLGARARLAREPCNPADPLAVAVWLEGSSDHPWRIGYLDRAVAARVAPRIDDGLALDARIDGWVTEPDGRWRRPIVLLLPRSHDHDDPRSLWGRPPGVIRRRVNG